MGEKDNILELAKRLENLAVEGVEDGYKEYHGDRKLRLTQSGRREKKKDDGELKVINKASVPFCQDIVVTAVAYLLGNPPTLQPSEENDVSGSIKKIWQKNRMESKLIDFAKIVKSEKIAAIVFYFNERNEIKSKLLSFEKGLLLPYFDEYGDLTAFGWKYKYNKKDRMHLFTDEVTYVLENSDGWKLIKEEINPFGKIPVVFLQQDEVEWHNVKWAIDRYEVLLSVQADINDEFGSPKYKVVGKVAKDNKDPRFIKLEIAETEHGNVVRGDVDIISAPNAVAAIELEMKTLKSIIYEQTQTINANFESVKGIGNISNEAMELMYQAAILKARFAEPDYEVVIDRCINVIKGGLAYLVEKRIPPYNGLSLEEIENTTYSVKFNSILPKSDESYLKLLGDLFGLGAISVRTAIDLNPLVKDKEAEVARIMQERMKVNESFNID